MKDSDWRILYELYRTPNITKVAARLYMSQPSLSRRVQAMESEYQVKILERTSKGIAFTRAGEILANNAQDYMKLLNRVQNQLKELKEEEKLVIQIGLPYSFSQKVMSRLLLPYSQKHQNVQFEIVNAAGKLLFEKACDHEIDLAFVRGDYEGDIEEKVINTRCGYILSKKPVNLKKLPRMQRLTYEMNDKTLELIENWWYERYNDPLPEGISAGEYMDLAEQMCSNGMGYVFSFLPDDYPNTYHLNMMQMTDSEGKPVVRRNWMVYKNQKDMNPSLREFLDYTASHLDLFSDI